MPDLKVKSNGLENIRHWTLADDKLGKMALNSTTYCSNHSEHPSNRIVTC